MQTIGTVCGQRLMRNIAAFIVSRSVEAEVVSAELQRWTLYRFAGRSPASAVKLRGKRRGAGGVRALTCIDPTHTCARTTN